MNPVAVYVHIPFCPSKCGYCDFNSYAMDGDIIERTVRATVSEIESGPHRGRPAKTIFFGGGTPTFLESSQIARILDAVVIAHPPADDCEISSEANPGTVDASKFADMRFAGFNRISIGAQSFQSEDLLRLGRVHSASAIPVAVSSARSAGFDNINLDLMFALPGQSEFTWRRNLAEATKLNTDHLSLYCLTIEPNTAFYKERLRGELDLPDDEFQVRMYDIAVEEAKNAGFVQYEISNFAKPGKECRHNLAYWHSEEYVAYGPGAVERIGETRWTHVKHPRAYCEAVEGGTNLACESETLSEELFREEQAMLGLRLNEGVTLPWAEPAKLKRLSERDWIEIADDRVKLTKTGRHYCNEVIVNII